MFLGLTTAIHTELSALLQERRDAIAEACAVKGMSDRVNALTMILREVMRESSVCYVDGTLSCYNGKSYEPVVEEDLTRKLRNLAVDMGVSPTDLQKVGRMPLDVLADEAKRHRGDRRHIAFSNCIFDLKNRVPLPFSRDLFVSASLPYPYKEGAGCGLFLRLLAEVLPDEGKRLAVQEFFGLCLADREPISIEKFAIFIGEGANGKSVVCDVMTRVFGLSRVSFLDPAQLADPKMLPDLKGKWVNIANDVRQDAAFDSALKALSSGQIVMARRNYHEPEQVVAPPLIFAMNRLPQFKDRSKGFERRILPIVFNVSIPESRQDRRLAQKICESDLCGIFRWCLEGLDRLMGNGGNFTMSEAMGKDLAAIMEKAKSPEPRPVKEYIESIGFSLTPFYPGQRAERISATDIWNGLRRRVSPAAIARELTALGVEKGRSNTTYYKVYKKD